MTNNTEFVPFINPATGEQFGQVPMATEAGIAQAYKEMRQASGIWGGKTVKERVRILRKFQALIIDSVDDISGWPGSASHVACTSSSVITPNPSPLVLSWSSARGTTPSS